MLSRFHTARPCLSVLGWLALAVFAWSQLAAAVHQFEHHANELDETCAVCLQLERNGQAAVDDHPDHSLALPTYTVEVVSIVFAPIRHFSLYRTRASP